MAVPFKRQKETGLKKEDIIAPAVGARDALSSPAALLGRRLTNHDAVEGGLLDKAYPVKGPREKDGKK
ncbi:MAG: hypothetical protein HY681_14600 [Chloroflexi bacterium]|nr:hypothetical protein [Chloroflexota bacterium]